MDTAFKKLNEGWNAEPNVPYPRISVVGPLLKLRFVLNSWAYEGFNDGDEAEILFSDCWQYRLGSPNDEGWHKGECRFSGFAPAWGEFYEVDGNLRTDKAPADWVSLGRPGTKSRHFLFYFRDETFECDAKDWTLLLPNKEA